MTDKTQFRIQFPTQNHANSFLADLNTLPGAARPQEWLHSAQVIPQTGVGQKPVWEIRLTAPSQVSGQVRRFATRNSAFKVESNKLPGDIDSNTVASNELPGDIDINGY